MAPTTRKIPTGTTRNGFTLVELLVVISIIGVLVALLLPAIQAAREAARRSQCNNQLRQIGLAIQMHHDANGVFPAGRNRTDQFGISWAYTLLPYMEEQAIYDAFDNSQRVDSDANATAMRTPIPTYACPSRRSPAADRDFDNNDDPPLVTDAAVLGDYAANAGLEENTGMEANDFSDGKIDLTLAGPIFSGSKIAARQVVDGLSKTLAVGEKHLRPVRQEWIDKGQAHYEQGDTCFLAGDNIQTIMRGTEDGLATTPTDNSDEAFGGLHPGVTLFVFLDGHTEAISEDGGTAIGVNPNEAQDIRIDDEWLFLGALSTVAGSEVVTE
jgi:prepilin-type N-terminal cleavage/methylation domain-containing protein